jgi:hypothetical protein
MRVIWRRRVGRFGPHERGVSMSGVYDELTDAEDYMSYQLPLGCNKLQTGSKSSRFPNAAPLGQKLH